jgi:hypothetical protein
MKTWFMIWMFASALVGYLDAIDPEEEDGRPWWGRAIGAMLLGGVLAAIPGCLAVLARLP